MTKQNRIALFALLFIGAIGTVGVLVVRPSSEKPFEIVANSSSNVEKIDKEKGGTLKETVPREARLNGQSGPDTVSVGEAAVSVQAAPVQTGMLNLTGTDGENSDDPFEGMVLFNPDDVAELLKKHGSYAAIYAMADQDQRHDLIDHLTADGLLRDELASILSLEDNSDTRAYLLQRVDPIGLFDDDGMNLSDMLTDEEDFFIDEDLKKLLDSPSRSDMERQEWLARIELANLIDSEYALNWIRDGQQVYPDDPSINILASTMLLNIAVGSDKVTSREREGAAKYIDSALNSANRSQYSVDERIRAYYAMYFAEDQGRTYEFLQNQKTLETDPKAQNVLNGLVDRMEKKGDVASAK